MMLLFNHRGRIRHAIYTDDAFSLLFSFIDGITTDCQNETSFSPPAANWNTEGMHDIIILLLLFSLSIYA